MTAIKLSFRNLMTKKGRTIMTAIAGSIGIIGVSLVLAISNGFTSYVTDLQTTVLSGYPIQIASSAIDTNAAMSVIAGMTADAGDKQYPDEDFVYGFDSSEMLEDIIIDNSFDQDYIDYVKEVEDKGWASSISYGYAMETTVVGPTIDSSGNTVYQQVNVKKSMLDGILGGSLGGKKTPSIGWYQMVGKKEFILSQYDMIAGSKFPSSANEVVLVVDTYNSVSVEVLMGLGFAPDECDQVSFDDIIGRKLTVVDNNALYKELETPSGNKQFSKQSGSEFFRKCCEEGGDGTTQLEVVAVLRLKPDVMLGLLYQGINYTPELTEYLLDVNGASPVAAAQAANTEYNVVTGERLSEATHKEIMQQLGGDRTPDSMNIYPVDFENKEYILDHLDAWNNKHIGNEVQYTDMSATATDMMNEIIRIISIVLVCFAAISLVVSSVMIGIITYVSVVERTKLFAGVIGIIVTYILQPIVNVIIQNLANMGSLTLCVFNPLHALLMIVISFCLTVIAGLVPSSVAAKRDPVVALRSE